MIYSWFQDLLSALIFGGILFALGLALGYILWHNHREKAQKLALVNTELEKEYNDLKKKA